MATTGKRTGEGREDGMGPATSTTGRLNRLLVKPQRLTAEAEEVMGGNSTQDCHGLLQVAVRCLACLDL